MRTTNVEPGPFEGFADIHEVSYTSDSQVVDNRFSIGRKFPDATNFEPASAQQESPKGVNLLDFLVKVSANFDLQTGGKVIARSGCEPPVGESAVIGEIITPLREKLGDKVLTGLGDSRVARLQAMMLGQTEAPSLDSEEVLGAGWSSKQHNEFATKFEIGNSRSEYQSIGVNIDGSVSLLSRTPNSSGGFHVHRMHMDKFGQISRNDNWKS